MMLSALALAKAALSPVADQAVKDGYAGLKELIVRRFDKGTAKALTEAGVDRDQKVLAQARELLDKAEATQPEATRALVNNIKAKNVTVANKIGSVTMN